MAELIYTLRIYAGNNFGQLLFPAFQRLKKCGTQFSNRFLSCTEQSKSLTELPNENSYISSSENHLVLLTKAHFEH